MKQQKRTLVVIALALLVAVIGGAYAAQRLLFSGAAETNRAAAAKKPVFAVYYLWWTTQHWHDLLGASYPYTKTPNPLPARLDSADKPTSLYAGNKLTDVSQKLAYNQDSPAVIEADVRAAAAHGIDGFSVNWKGTGSASQTPSSTTFNKRLQSVFDAVKKVNAAGIPFKLQLNYQASAQHLPVAWIKNDIAYYVHTYGASSAQDHSFSKRPSMIWVGSWKYSNADVTAVSKAIRPMVYLFGDEGQTKWDANAAASFDGDSYYWSSQDPIRNPQSISQVAQLAAKVRSTKNPDGSAKTWLAPFTPGFNAVLRYGSGTAIPRQGGATMRKLFDGNAKSNPDGWTFISWNEIAEGSYIVPLTRFGDYYLRQIASVIGSAPAPSPQPPPPPVTTPPPPPVTTTTPPAGSVSKVLVFIEENHSLAQMQAGMPYLYSQAQKYAYATSYTAAIHPSLGNYLAIAFGNTFGVTDDAAPPTHNQTAPDAFTATIQAGRQAKNYQESMTGNCKSSSGGGYAVKHNPWAYASSAAAHSACLQGDVPSGTSTAGALHDDIASGALPNVGTVTPNLSNDAHDGSLATADAWLKAWLTQVYAGPDWAAGRLAVVVTADEDSGGAGNKVLTVVLHPSLSGKVVSTPLTHYSLNALLTQVGHAACIANGCSAPSFAQAFGLSIG